MKRTRKSIVCMLLGLLLITVFLSACTKEKSETSAETQQESVSAKESEVKEETAKTETEKTDDEQSDEETLPMKELSLPLTEEKQELTVWIRYSGTIMADLNEIEGAKRMEELTNVHINWIAVNQGETAEKFGTMIASGNYPDIIVGDRAYPGGDVVAMEDGFLNENMDYLIRNYMPNYMSLLESNDVARREATDDSGALYSPKLLVCTDTQLQSEGTFSGLAYRADLLEKLGLDIPTTIEGWHDALVHAKEAGIDNPFVLDTNGGSAISLSWGVLPSSAQNGTIQMEGTKLVCGQATEGYRGYLETMKQWYSEGLINPNFTSFNYYLDTPGSVEKGETLLYSTVISNFTGNSYYQYHMCNAEEEFLQPIYCPALNEGDEPIDGGFRAIAKLPMYISSQCKNPELAAKWLDFQFSQEGIRLNWYGIEGVTYEIGDDGTPEFTELVLADEGGMGPSDVLQKYALNWGNCFLGAQDVSASWKVSTAIAGGYNQQLEAVDIWSSPKTNISVSGAITLTEEESSEVTPKMTAIKTMIDEYTINYIIGEDVMSFDEYIDSLNQYGLQEILEIYQNAYNRYLAR